MEKNEKRYAKLLRQIRPVLVRRYGEDKTGKLLRDMEPIYDRFLAETPSIGGKKNPMSVNTDMALPFFALYEVSGRSISAEVINEMLDVVMVSQYRKIGQFVNVNRLDKPWLIKRLYRLMELIEAVAGTAQIAFGLPVGSVGHAGLGCHVQVA